MAGDDTSDTPSFREAYERRLQEKTEAFDREFGLVLHPLVEGPFAGLINRLSAAATFNLRDPTHPLVEIGRFEGLRELGQGSFGAVVKARDTELDRLVALKLFPAGSHTEEDLRREARALAKVRHPNIIEIYDVGSHAEEDALFIVMQYVQGVSLKEFALSSYEKKRPWREVLELFIQVGEALATLHEQGVVHGDFKPANVVVDKSTGMPYIVDFGLANIMVADAGAREQAAIRGGTLHYMAPELLHGGNTSVLADQYAFCVSLWHCLDEDPPYVGVDTDRLIEDIDVVAEDACFIDKTLPDRFRELLIVGLDQDPGKRYADMRALVQALELARGPVLAPDPQEQVTVEPASDHRPKPKGLGPVFGLMLLVSMAGVLGERYIAQRAESSEATESVEQDPKAVGIASRKTYCVLDGAPTTDVSPELEAVCEHIRAGRFKRASDLWEGIRATLEPKSGAPDDVRRQQYTVLERETRIVGETFADEAESMKKRGGKLQLITNAQLTAGHWDSVAALDKQAANELAPRD